ncbi:MAG TPA: helix-turn-helix domain-containing protein [Firmicutes bacterium]|nr:helix-turn-helix domain-containing protein [Candidatus Fermentithermobacillaceae bacterium]
MERLLTPDEAASLLRVSVYTIKEYARKGIVPAIKVGGIWRFPESGLVKPSPSAYPVASGSHNALAVKDAVAHPERREFGSRKPENPLVETLYEKRRAASKALEAIRARSRPCSVANMVREAKEEQRFRGDGIWV